MAKTITISRQLYEGPIEMKAVELNEGDQKLIETGIVPTLDGIRHINTKLPGREQSSHILISNNNDLVLQQLAELRKFRR